MRAEIIKKATRWISLTTLSVLAGILLMPVDAKAQSPNPVEYFYYKNEADAIAGKSTSGTENDYIEVTANNAEWGQDGKTTWWVVNASVTNNDHRIKVKGDVRLILCDGATLTANKGIEVVKDSEGNDNNKLTIYGQSKGTGKLIAKGSESSKAGIGGCVSTSEGSSVVLPCAALTIHGADIYATGGPGGAGIGCGRTPNKGDITIYGGTINAAGGDGADESDGGAGIYCGLCSVMGNASIKALGGKGATSGSAYVSDGGHGIAGALVVESDSASITAIGGDGAIIKEGHSAGDGIRLELDPFKQYSEKAALKVTEGSPIIQSTGGNATDGKGGKGIGTGTAAPIDCYALLIASGSPQITSTGGNSTSGKAGDGIYGPTSITTDSDIASVLAIRGDGKEGDAIAGGITVSAGFAAFSRMSEDALWLIDSEINGSQTTTITRKSFAIESKYGRIFKSYYSVVLDQNGGSGIFVDPLYYELDDTVTLPANTYTRNGYSFTGWNTKEDGSGKPYADGAAITISAGATDLDEDRQLILYAQWEKYPDPVITRYPAVISGLVYNGKAQVLITEGEVTGGEMQYALGKDATTEPTENWSTSIPTATEAGTYYVWYKVKGDVNHSDTAPKSMKVTISPKPQPKDTLTITLNKTSFTYNGKVQKPAIKSVKYKGKTLNKKDYTISYSKGSKNAGTYKVNVKGKGEYKGQNATAKYVINKAPNPLKVTAAGKPATLKSTELAKKSKTIAASKLLTVKKAQGTKSYKITGVTASEYKNYFQINAKTGKLTVKKGLTKGTYALTIQVTAKGTGNYKPANKTVKAKVKVQ